MPCAQDACLAGHRASHLAQGSVDCLLSYLFDSSVASRFKRNENIAIAHTSVARVAAAIVLRGIAGVQ